jgi:putative ABC transport system permease protein
MREIVGVIADVKQSGLGAETAPEIYAPLAQSPFSPVFVVVRTVADPRSYAGAIRHRIAVFNKNAPMYHIETLDGYFVESLLLPRLVTLLLSGFALLAVILACLGVYGVASYVTAQRTHEIGVRMALGSRRVEITRLILREGLPPAIIGVLTGIAISLKATALLSSLLYGLKPTDPLTFAATFLLMLGVTLFASYIPARCAARLDPMQSLRYE